MRFFFSHSYEDVVLQQNDVVLQESPLSFFSLTRTSFFVREKKLNGLSFRTTSFCFRTTSSYYVREKNPQTFPLQDKRESDFPSRLHHFAAGEKIDKKILHPSVSQSSHDLLGNKKPLSHFSSGNHIYEGTPSYIHRTLPFSIFCYLTKLIFFPFC